MQATDAAEDREAPGEGQPVGPRSEMAAPVDRVGPDLLNLFPATGGSARFYANLSDI